MWATIPDSHGGNAKSRPAIIVTPTKDIDPDGEIQLAAITTLTGDAPFSETVELPFDPCGHPQTKLKKPCEVVCTWICAMPAASIRDSGGFAPSDVLLEILAKIRDLS